MRFQTKIVFSILLLIVVAFGAGSSLLLMLSFQSSMEREKSAALHNYQVLLYSLDVVDGSYPSSLYADMYNILYQLDVQDSGWCALRLKQDNIILYSSLQKGAFQNDLTKEMPMHQYAMQVFHDEGECYLQIAGKFLCGNHEFILDALYPLDDLYLSRTIQIRQYQLVFTIVALLGLITTWSISQRLTEPLHQISIALRQITDGDLSARATVYTKDEFESLARDLNQMTDRLENNIKALEENIRRQEEFMGSVAHELKTPLTTIIGYADLLRGQTLTEEEHQEAANYIFSEGKRLERLSFKLLDLIMARKNDFEIIPVYPNRILQEVLSLMEQRFQQQKITVQYQSDSGICLLEPDLFRSLLINLLDNACKAMDRPGKIKIQLRTDQNRTCYLQIHDNGRGMAEEELERIQIPFYRVDKSRSRAQGGVGLGLALCNEIVLLHHGTLCFTSELGKGTSVFVTLQGGNS